MRQIYGLGETVLDIIFGNDQPRRAVPGGSTFNAIVSLGRCRLQPIMVTETGDDHVGSIIANFLKENGICTDYITVNAGRKTPVSLAFLDEHNDAHYQFYKDATTHDVPRCIPHFTQDDVVIFGSFYAVNPALRNFTQAFLQRAHDAGATLYYDLNFRPAHKDDLPRVMEAIEENMRMSTIVRASHEDLACVYGQNMSEEAAIEHLQTLCHNLIVTHGADGVDFYSPTLTRHFATTPIATVSTIGAGDNFNAGIVQSIVTEQWSTADLQAPTLAMITSMNERAQQFAANVCQSMENYVSTDFANTL